MQLDGLKTICSKKLKKRICNTNVTEILIFALKQKDTNLQTACAKLFIKRGSTDSIFYALSLSLIKEYEQLQRTLQKNAFGIQISGANTNPSRLHVILEKLTDEAKLLLDGLGTDVYGASISIEAVLDLDMDRYLSHVLPRNVRFMRLSSAGTV